MPRKSTKVEAVSTDAVSTKSVLQEAIALSKSLEQLYKTKPTSEIYSAIVTTESLVRSLKTLK